MEISSAWHLIQRRIWLVLQVSTCKCKSHCPLPLCHNQHVQMAVNRWQNVWLTAAFGFRRMADWKKKKQLQILLTLCDFSCHLQFNLLLLHFFTHFISNICSYASNTMMTSIVHVLYVVCGSRFIQTSRWTNNLVTYSFLPLKMCKLNHPDKKRIKANSHVAFQKKNIIESFNM